MLRLHAWWLPGSRLHDHLWRLFKDGPLVLDALWRVFLRGERETWRQGVNDCRGRPTHAGSRASEQGGLGHRQPRPQTGQLCR